MASLKTRCLLVFAALLPLSITPTAAEVMGSISDCAEFFLQDTPPCIPGVLEGGRNLNQNRYKTICQTWNNKRRFVTLYDTNNKIPVFSACKYKRPDASPRPKTKWKVEPQTYNYQAGDSDYKNASGFDRGHLLPSSYGANQDDRISTFTLTNIVPQVATFNQGSWRRMESCIKCVMDKYCVNSNSVEGFVVIGAQPSTNNTLNNIINIPSMLWSAFCCYSDKEGKWLASAHWGENVPDQFTHLQTKTLAELHDKLRTSTSGLFSHICIISQFFLISFPV
uniref:Uncharacterized protein n=1 Tax=Mola mola TaxID=94237 RepID=A0A3Q3WMK0_MOLML